MKKQNKDLVVIKNAQIMASDVLNGQKVIASQSDLIKATEILSTLNKALDTVTEDKKKITDPLNATLKEIRFRYKPAEEALENAIEHIRSKMTIYQTEQVNIQKAEEKRIADRVGAGKGHYTVDTAVAKIEALDKPLENIEGSNGSLSFREVKCFEVVDKMKLPPEYLLADEVAIRKQMVAGNELQGVRYFSEQRPINSR